MSEVQKIQWLTDWLTVGGRRLAELERTTLCTTSGQYEARFPFKRNRLRKRKPQEMQALANASDCVWMETGLDVGGGLLRYVVAALLTDKRRMETAVIAAWLCQSPTLARFCFMSVDVSTRHVFSARRIASLFEVWYFAVASHTRRPCCYQVPLVH